MNNLTNEQIARLFAPYIGVQVKLYKTALNGNARLEGVSVKTADVNYEGGIMYQPIDNVKLLLTPLSKISDEDAIELAKIHGYNHIEESIQIVREGLKNIDSLEAVTNALLFESYKFLLSSGYDFPQYIEPNHPDNGKTLIELGLAIDKTTLI